jgi:hypothetical protein
MEFILITCSKGKLTGGKHVYQHSKRLADGLGNSTFNRLLELRRELVSLCEKPLPKGLELGFSGYEATAEYMPAYQRYVGRIYQFARVGKLYPQAKHIRLAIISAMYGLLDADDLIQNYDLRMDEKLSNIYIYTWWRRYKLGDCLEKYIQACNPEIIHDLLPREYREALQPWPPENLQGRVKQYNFPGPAAGAMQRRAEVLHQLLTNLTPNHLR